MSWRHRNVFSISHTILLILLPAALVLAQPGQPADPTGNSSGVSGDDAGDLLSRLANYQSALAELDGNYDASSIELLTTLAEARIEAGQLVDAGSSRQTPARPGRTGSRPYSIWPMPTCWPRITSGPVCNMPGPGNSSVTAATNPPHCATG